VIRAGVIRIGGEHALELRDDLGGVGGLLRAGLGQYARA
jgi:hypothetical protein